MATKLYKATCGDTIFLYDGAGAANVEKQIRSRLAKGEMATLADGSKQWIEDNAVVDLTKSGSDQYTWAADGNRVLHKKVLCTKSPDGRIDRRLIRKIYKSLD